MRTHAHNSRILLLGIRFQGWYQELAVLALLALAGLSVVLLLAVSELLLSLPDSLLDSFEDSLPESLLAVLDELPSDPESTRLR
jgi:hypothetical protein